MFQTLIESPANTMDCQQPQQQQQRAAARPRATRVRRTRQAKNPQLSVARRNERERNRVKMVNNGFALLRDRLPVEYLQQSGGGQSGYESAASDSTPADLKSNAAASKSSQAKKFSKVETLRAAIEHIRMLERLMRSVEPEFESVCQLQRDQAPASCGSVSLASSSSSQLVGATQLAASVPGQFVKLEPQHHQQQHQPMEQQQQQQLEQTFEPNEPQQLHTHLWLEQHQESFIEQQRDWYQQQQQLQHTDADHQTQLHHIQPHDLNQNQNQNQWLYLDHNQQQQQQQQQSTFQQLQQPNYTTDQHQSHLMHLNLNHHHHQFQPQHQQFAQHQISLYSQ